MTAPPPLNFPICIVNYQSLPEGAAGMPWFVEWSDGSTARYTEDAYRQMWTDLMGWANLREIVKEIVREELHIIVDLIGGPKP